MDVYKVQVGRGKKGRYSTKYAFNVEALAFRWYTSINIGNEYKKRLTKNDRVIARDKDV